MQLLWFCKALCDFRKTGSLMHALKRQCELTQGLEGEEHFDFGIAILHAFILYGS